MISRHFLVGDGLNKFMELHEVDELMIALYVQHPHEILVPPGWIRERVYLAQYESTSRYNSSVFGLALRMLFDVEL